MNLRRKLIVIGMVVAAVLVLTPVVYHYQLKIRTNRLRSELQNKGVLKPVSQLACPAVPNEQDGLPILLSALKLAPTNEGAWYTNAPKGMRMVAPGKAITHANQPEVRDGKYFNTWDQILGSLKPCLPALDELVKLGNSQGMNFNLNYNLGFEEGNYFKEMELIKLKRAAILLGSAAVSDLHSGKEQAALEKIVAINRLTSGVLEQRLIISFLVGNAISHIAHAPTWSFLQSSNCTEPQLAKLQSEWERLDFLRSYDQALAMELSWGNNQFNKDRHLNNTKLRNLVMGEDSSWSARPKLLAWRYFWSYEDEMRALPGAEIILNCAHDATKGLEGAAILKKQEHGLAVLGLDSEKDVTSAAFETPDLHSIASSSVSTVGASLKPALRCEAGRRMTVTAIALKRFHLKYKHYPEHLAQLVPEFLKSEPMDPAAAKPLSYRLNPDQSFMLYSVGEDGVDDGGNAAPSNPESKNLTWYMGHDWVWPQPASEAEIRAWKSKAQ